MCQSDNKEVILKIINFLKEKPHFYDESNLLFYDAFQKRAEKIHFGNLFDPPLSVGVVSAKIRYIIRKVIDNHELIRKKKKAKWIYFDQTKFMLPALLCEQETHNKTGVHEKFSNTKCDNIDRDQSIKVKHGGTDLCSKDSSNKTQKPDEVYCRICNFFCPSHLFSSHFELRYHQKGEVIWKKQKSVQTIQCPSCDCQYKTWFEFLKHIKTHQLREENLNYKAFKIENGKLSIDMNVNLPTTDGASGLLYSKLEHLREDYYIYRKMNMQ